MQCVFNEIKVFHSLLLDSLTTLVCMHRLIITDDVKVIIHGDINRNKLHLSNLLETKRFLNTI
jgi:hypothetical protein